VCLSFFRTTGFIRADIAALVMGGGRVMSTFLRRFRIILHFVVRAGANYIRSGALFVSCSLNKTRPGCSQLLLLGFFKMMGEIHERKPQFPI